MLKSCLDVSCSVERWRSGRIQRRPSKAAARLSAPVEVVFEDDAHVGPWAIAPQRSAFYENTVCTRV